MGSDEVVLGPDSSQPFRAKINGRETLSSIARLALPRPCRQSKFSNPPFKSSCISNLERDLQFPIMRSETP